MRPRPMSRLEKLLTVALLLLAYALAGTVDAQGAAAMLLLPLRAVRHLAWWARFQIDPWANVREELEQ